MERVDPTHTTDYAELNVKSGTLTVPTGNSLGAVKTTVAAAGKIIVGGTLVYGSSITTADKARIFETGGSATVKAAW